MTKVGQTLGRWGEDIAAKHLVEQGMVILDRNWRTSAGEIDIIARHVDVLIFCEVKTRRSKAFGSGGEAVTERKTSRLRRLASQWLAISRIRPSEIRFDVISVQVTKARPEISHIRGAF